MKPRVTEKGGRSHLDFHCNLLEQIAQRFSVYTRFLQTPGPGDMSALKARVDTGLDNQRERLSWKVRAIRCSGINHPAHTHIQTHTLVLQSVLAVSVLPVFTTRWRLKATVNLSVKDSITLKAFFLTIRDLIGNLLIA